MRRVASEPAVVKGYTRAVVNRRSHPAGEHPYGETLRSADPAPRPRHEGVPASPSQLDEALDRVVAGFQAAKAAHGPTTFGTFSCSKATNEVNFAAQKFSRVVLGSNNIDSCNRT